MSTFAALFFTTYLLVLFISIFTPSAVGQAVVAPHYMLHASIASIQIASISHIQQRQIQLPKLPKLNILHVPQIPGYKIPLFQTRDKAVTSLIPSLIKDGVNSRDYLLALGKAVGKCNDAVVDVLVSKNFDLNSKSKSLIDGKTVREDVYDVIDCALVTNTKCEDLLYAARTGDIDKFDVSGSYFQKCKLKDEYTPLDNLVAMG